MKIPHFCVLGLLLQGLLASSVLAAAPELLSYWNFNNAKGGSETGLGVFLDEAVLSGEAFDPATQRLSANSNFNTVFHGDTVYVDFSEFPEKMGGPVSQSWGAFTDTRVNKLKTDDTVGASFMTGAVVGDGISLTFVLSSEGYDNLEVSYAHRTNSASSIAWSYSLDGQSFTPIREIDRQTAFTKETLNLSGPEGQGLNTLNNQKTFYLRATLHFPGKPSGNAAIDNFQLTGTPAS